MKSLNKRPLIVAILIGSVTLFSACRKKDDTVAKIYVRDINNAAVDNARVILWPNPDPVLKPTIPDDTSYTNDEGVAYFNYTDDFNLGQAGFRVLDIRVEAGDLQGTGIIKVVEEQTSTATVVVSVP